MIITTRAIGKMYNLTGIKLERVRLYLARLGYIQKDRTGSAQAYTRVKALPTDVDVLHQEYSDRYYKTNPVSAFEDALSEVESLSEEMTSWRDNMGQHEGLSATQKYEEVETAADTLENQQSELDSIQSDLEKLDGLDEIELTVAPPYDPHFYGHSMGRAKRLANALADLNGVKEGLELYKIDKSPEDQLNIDQLVDQLDNAISELEGVDFPSML